LFERVRTLLNGVDVRIDQSDLIKEVSIFAERSDIAEEVTRLDSHLAQFQEFMNDAESRRKLEFLTQEMFARPIPSLQGRRRRDLPPRGRIKRRWKRSRDGAERRMSATKDRCHPVRPQRRPKST